MAVPSYTTDLTTIDTAEALTNWLELGTWTAGTVVLEPDFFIQGANCIAKYMVSGAVGLGGMAANAGTPLTIPSPGGFFVWMMGQCPNIIDTEALGGLRLVCGNLATAFNAWKVKGKDTYTYGGWICFVVDPTVAVDYTVGAPTTDRQWFGGAINQLANAKGGLGIDVVRYGRGEARIANGSAIDGFATFSGFATQNDANANRWGLIQAIDGGYLQQGLVIFGYVTATDFRDSNTSILIANTKKVISSFNAFEVRQATSRVDLTSVSFQALGTVAKGNWITTNNATINITGCTFTDMGTFGFLASSTILTSTFRRTDQITTGGATFTSCTIDKNISASAMLAASPANAALISNTAFTSDGTGHAIEIGGTAANMTLTGNTYTGYAASDGSTGNEMVYVNIATGSMNLTISGGTTPSVRTAGAAVTVISGAVNVTVTVQNVSGANIENANVYLPVATGGPFPYQASVTITNSGTTATVTHTSHGLATNDKVRIKGASLAQNNGVFTITVTGASTYTYTMSSAPGSNPTGTITSTFVVLYGLTNVSGQITMSRVFPSAQPISGWTRKSSATPFYKTALITGSVSATTGFSATALLISDE